MVVGVCDENGKYGTKSGIRTHAFFGIVVVVVGGGIYCTHTFCHSGVSVLTITPHRLLDVITLSTHTFVLFVCVVSCLRG